MIPSRLFGMCTYTQRGKPENIMGFSRISGNHEKCHGVLICGQLLIPKTQPRIFNQNDKNCKMLPIAS